MERIQLIAGKNLGYNRDIDQHIISCRISLEIIRQKDIDINETLENNQKLIQEINTLEDIIKVKEEELRQKATELRRLQEEKLRIENQKDREIMQYKQIIDECYLQIDKLTFG